MANPVYFKEVQHFRQLWLILLVLFSTVPAIVIVAFVPDEEEIWVKLVVISILILTLAMIFIIRLETEITKEGIRYKFWPFHPKPRMIRYEDIKKIEVRKYEPLSEYGGWGIKGTSKNRAYNVSGTIGIQIELKSGKKLLLGTNKKDEAETIVRRIELS
jgi:hypothetical protein